MTVNKVILIGRLGRDPEARATASGSSVTNMSLATNERWTDQQGQRQERTEWHRVVTFGRNAENCAKYLRKGSQVFVEGRLQTRDWEDRDGNKRYTTEVVAQAVRFLDSEGQGGGGSRGEYGSGGGPEPQPFEEDDVPFVVMAEGYAA